MWDIPAGILQLLTLCADVAICSEYNKEAEDQLHSQTHSEGPVSMPARAVHLLNAVLVSFVKFLNAVADSVIYRFVGVLFCSCRVFWR
jgi:hypothetical protein